ncbi:MAG: Crp/Fnr family transcriptional regulator [Burkholderiales bacterium]|nr:Crp/Fnr family transcriptional regulator [Burkholderiales bacterium]
MSDLRTLIGATPWAKSLKPEEFTLMFAAIIERRVPAGAYVCRKGEPADVWIGVLEGLVKMSSLSPDGKPITFTGVPTGGWFGEGSIIKHPEPRLYDVVALRDSRIAYLPRATFMQLLDRSIGFNRFLLLQINERLGQFIATVEFDRLLEPDARVARALAQLYNPLLYPGTTADLQLSQEEIGLLSGLSRQRANQALRVLEEARLLKLEYGGVRVQDVEGLRRFV